MTLVTGAGSVCSLVRVCCDQASDNQLKRKLLQLYTELLRTGRARLTRTGLPLPRPGPHVSPTAHAQLGSPDIKSR